MYNPDPKWAITDTIITYHKKLIWFIVLTGR